MIDAADFLKTLAFEHRIYREVFDEIRGAPTQVPTFDQLDSLRFLCGEFLENYHERREEDVLFPALRPDRRIHAGGPECTLHFDYFLADRPLERADKVFRELGLPPGEARWNAGAVKDRSVNSPLCLPGEDHEAGRVLLRAYDALLTAETPELRERRWRLLETFDRLQSAHHRREDRCFFRMCADLIPSGDRAAWAASDPPWAPDPSQPGASTVIAAVISRGLVICPFKGATGS